MRSSATLIPRTPKSILGPPIQDTSNHTMIFNWILIPLFGKMRFTLSPFPSSLTLDCLRVTQLSGVHTHWLMCVCVCVGGYDELSDWWPKNSPFLLYWLLYCDFIYIWDLYLWVLFLFRAVFYYSCIDRRAWNLICPCVENALRSTLEWWSVWF